MGSTHPHELGAARVNIFFFLIMLVLFLGALFFGYVQLSDNTALADRATAHAAENRQLKLDIQVRDHYIEDVRDAVGEAGNYVGREGYTYIDPDDTSMADLTVSPLENVALPDNILSATGAFASQVGVSSSNRKPLANLFAETRKVFDAKDKRITDLQGQNTTLSAQVSAAQKSVSEATTQRQSEVAALDQANNEIQQTIEAEYNKLRTQIDGLRQEVQRHRSDLDSAKDDHASQVASMTKDKTLLRAQLAVMADRDQLRNPPNEPDGRIISSSQAAGRAWINLGKKDMLPRGTVFRIVSADDQSMVKARGRVMRLDYDKAEVELFDVADRLDPVVKGDQISNDVYSPGMKRHIYLMGRFSYPLTKPTVKLILEKLGNKVHDKIGPGIDLVLVGSETLNEDGDGFTPVEESEDYKAALFLNIEIATLNKVRDFLELGDD